MSIFTSNNSGVKAGVQQGNWQAYANLSLANKAETGAGPEFKGGTGAQIGGSYNMNDYTLFAEHKMIKGSDEATDVDIDISSTFIGAGKADFFTQKINQKIFRW